MNDVKNMDASGIGQVLHSPELKVSSSLLHLTTVRRKTGKMLLAWCRLPLKHSANVTVLEPSHNLR